ncbi:chloride channel protein C-like [Crotalus adamanteus]|uniref:Chloride channel protein n=1 Tax=Crotalus adamanteus TaxID=8729 RepID=A0AAW1BM92_CROAD
MLLAEEQPDLIDSLDLQCKGNSNNSHCSRKNSLQEKGDEHSVHESLDYLPSHSNIYKKWLQEQAYRMDWDRWLVMGTIGTAIGILGFLTHQIIDYLIKLKWGLVEDYLQKGNFHMAWIYMLGIGFAMIILSSGLVVFFCPTGAFFVFLNIRINKIRLWFFSTIQKPSLRKSIKLLECILILILTITATVYLPYFFHCTPVRRLPASDLTSKSQRHHLSWQICKYNCKPATLQDRSNETEFFNQTFNEAAALLAENGMKGIMYLFRRGTHEEFGYPSLFMALLLYFLLSCLTSGSAVASGLVIPMLYIGALYGRIVGLVLVSIFGIQTDESHAWIDPGLFAAIGAASFFSGVSRLTISLTVIMVEITNDVQSLLLIMLAVMLAKMVGDWFNMSLYSSLLKLKSIPYLDVEPFAYENKNGLNLELFAAKDVMKLHVRVFNLKENIAFLAQVLASTSHCGFPVVYKSKPEQSKVFLGTITRPELCMLLENETIFEMEDTESHPPLLPYQKIRTEKLPNQQSVTAMLAYYTTDPRYQQLFINLDPYVNKSAVSVQAHFSLQRTYIIFRSLGLRHLTVVDLQNKVVGIITRKDLISFQVEKKLGSQKASSQPHSDDALLD